jgi:hypothetical protein
MVLLWMEVKREEAFLQKGWDPDYEAGCVVWADVDSCEIHGLVDDVVVEMV